jgi:hypothetical protein
MRLSTCQLCWRLIIQQEVPGLAIHFIGSFNSLVLEISFRRKYDPTHF